MAAPSMGGVQLPRGNGQTVRLPRVASLTDLAERINAQPRPSSPPCSIWARW